MGSVSYITMKYTLILLIVAVLACVVGLVQFLYLYFGPCRNRTDIIFMLDDSASIKDESFNYAKDFVKQIITDDELSVERSYVNVAIASFATRADWIGPSHFHY